MIMSDNGTEYTLDKFKNYYEEASIRHQLTNIYAPQQNQVCERKNKIMMDMTRWLLFESKLPNEFWVQAVNTFVYLLNKMPTKVVKEKTPFEDWFDYKPLVSHLKVFGCICFVNVP